MFFIGAYGLGVRAALLAAQDNDMMNGVYAFYALETVYSFCTDSKDTAERNEAACKAFEGLIDIRQYVPETAEYLYFQSEVRRRMPEMGNYVALAPDVAVSIQIVIHYLTYLLSFNDGKFTLKSYMFKCSQTYNNKLRNYCTR